MNRKVMVLSVVLFATVAVPSLANDFTLQDHLGHTWKNERVTFPLTSKQAEMAKKNLALVGKDDKEISYQLILDSSKQPTRICFHADLTPFEKRVYRFSDQPARATSGITVQESDSEIRIDNKRIGLVIRKKINAGEGPIAGLRLQSGEWTGDSFLMHTPPVKSYSTSVTASGPVFVEVQCLVTFANEGTWNLRCRIEHAEPVVILEEKFDLPGGGLFQVHLGSEAYQPKHLLYRSGMGGRMGQVNSQALSTGRAFLLEPWLHWWGSEQQGNWFALFTDTLATEKEPSIELLSKDKKEDLVESLLGTEEKASKPDAYPDMLMIGLLRPSIWRDPQWSGRASHVGLNVLADFDDDLVKVSFPLGGGNRVWMLATPDKKESIGVLAEKERVLAPLPQHFLIKHGDFPLDVVKDYVLEWEGEQENYPRLFLGKQELEALNASLKSDPREIRRWEAGQAIDPYNLDNVLHAYFASGSAQIGKNIVKKSTEWLSTSVQDGLMLQNSRVALGVAPHMQAVQLLPTLNLTDVALGVDSLTLEQRRQMLAQLALIGYVVNRDDYWSPARGFSANPNMTTTVAQYQVTVAALIPSHPMAKQWATSGLRTLTYQLQSWSDEEGGWLEAPHYAMVAYDHMLGAFLMAKRAGFADHLHDDRMKLIAKWFAQISTPPDIHTDGHRHHPPIGNTYYGESTGMFGIIAGLWKERDPEFAAHMQWMYQQHGSADIGLGGAFPALAGYKELLKAQDVTPEEPTYGSAWFQKTGVVLRSKLGSERETYLYMIAGSNHEHYDFDSGSIVLWGKGRVLVDDWGYIGRHGQQFHSLMSSSAIGGNMRVTEFSTQPSFDYVSGRKGAWQRQIGLVKDEDPAGNTFFLIRDTHHADSPATWRLWLTSKPDAELTKRNTPTFPLAKKAKSNSLLGDTLDDIESELQAEVKGNEKEATSIAPVSIHAQGVNISGEDDVDFDLFIYQPDQLTLKTETVSQDMLVGRRDSKTGPLRLTQTALTASLKNRSSITVLVYPRLKSEPAPQVVWHAGGQIAELISKQGTDFVYLAASEKIETLKAFDVKEHKLSFRGVAGSVQLRNNRATVSLGETGEIHFGETTLSSKTATTKSVPR